MRKAGTHTILGVLFNSITAIITKSPKAGWKYRKPWASLILQVWIWEMFDRDRTLPPLQLGESIAGPVYQHYAAITYILCLRWDEYILDLDHRPVLDSRNGSALDKIRFSPGTDVDNNLSYLWTGYPGTSENILWPLLFRALRFESLSVSYPTKIESP